MPYPEAILGEHSSHGLEPSARTSRSRHDSTDAYEIYESLSRKESAIARIGCLAHARRYLYKASRENFVWPSGLLLRFARFGVKTR
jgi:hypothetical protein